MNNTNNEEEFSFTPDLTLEDLRKAQRWFVDARRFKRSHKPRNLILAMMGEVGELAEIFQWKGEVEEGLPKFSDKEKQHVGEEMSDVLIYLIALADRCQVDLTEAVRRKFQLNALKYPIKNDSSNAETNNSINNDNISPGSNSKTVI